MAGAWKSVAPIRVGAPSIGDRSALHRRLDEILDRAWLTNHGPVERELEERLRDVAKTRHCIPVSSATLGLLVALKALVVEGQVLMPAFTFPALAHVTKLIGLEPVFCDIDPCRHHLDPSDAARRLTEDTAAVVGVHLWGAGCDTTAIEAMAGDLPVLYDAAQAFGAHRDGAPIGGNGRCEVFSFHATKFVNGFEGGAIATDDDELAARLRLMVNFGFAGRDTVVALGINAKLSEVHAAMALVSLDLLPQLRAANREHLERYTERLRLLPGIELRSRDDGGNLSYVVVEIDEAEAGCGRDRVIERLRGAGIDARRYFHPGVHRMAPHDERPTCPLPVTETVVQRVMQLPTGLALTGEQVDRVCDELAMIVAEP